MRDSQTFHLHARRRRAQGATALMWLVLSGLIFVFFHTQVRRNPAYAMQSDRNRLRPLTLLAPRGTIVDRDGRLVADNVPGYALSLLPAPRDSIRSTLDRLAPLLALEGGEIDRLMVRQRRHPQQQLVVSTDISFERISAIEERRPMFPEVLIEMRPKRNYAAGAAAAHLIGYVGEISERELADSVWAAYRAGQVIGKTGVERQYEDRLAGEPGVRYVEVDALGRIVGQFAGQQAVAPVPGDSLQLAVDLELQRWVAGLLADTVRGAVVALEPNTAQVLALYSSPSFDPNDLVGNVPPQRWRALQRDTAKRLLNRAIAGLYPPGSTWKLATAGIGLELGIIDAESNMPLACRGGMQYGNRYFRCWEPDGHGHVDMPDAIKTSCDVYFYQLGLQIGLARLLQEGIALGFDEPTHVDLPSERAGHFPPDTEWYERRFGWSPTESEVMSLAIGQGANDQTALKMAQFFGALIGDGRMPPPRVILGASEPDPSLWLDLGWSEETLAWMREGLYRVTEQGGTAAGSQLEHWKWGGKTGTSQNPHGEDHGWFVGVAGPWDGPPEVIVSAIVEEGEHGSDVAQIAAKVADFYLRRQHGIPIDTIQTLREHWLNGVPAPWARWEY